MVVGPQSSSVKCSVDFDFHRFCYLAVSTCLEIKGAFAPCRVCCLGATIMICRAYMIPLLNLTSMAWFVVYIGHQNGTCYDGTMSSIVDTIRRV